jgi:hypothetical protein
VGMDRVGLPPKDRQKHIARPQNSIRDRTCSCDSFRYSIPNAI